MMESKAVWAGAFAFALSVTSASAATSNFNTNSEGWSVLGDSAGPVTWMSSGGNPGGYVSVTDSVVGGVMYFVAPGAYLGDMSSAYGTALTFDLIQNYPESPDQFADDDVLLMSSALTLAYDFASYPVNGAWTPYSVSLTAGAWHIGSGSGAVATEAQIQSVLSNLTGLQIRAEYQTGADTDGLDTVSFGTSESGAAPEPSTWAMMILGFCGLGFMAIRRRNGAFAARPLAFGAAFPVSSEQSAPQSDQWKSM
jgi:hypothetical protein